MLLGNKTADEIEAFGGSQEAWGNPFLFDLKNIEEQVQAKQAFLQRSEYSSVPWDVARTSVEMVSRFLGFSVSPSGIWSLGDAEDSGEDRRLQRGCAQLPRGVFGSLSFGSRGSQTWKTVI